MTKRNIILTFHGIGTPQRDLEPGEHPYWVSESRFREIVDLAAALSDRVQCEFAIDDGNISDATIAAPYLAKRGFAAQFFVLTDRIGKAGSLDRAALRDLTDMGHAIGSHGSEHKDWRKLDSQGYVREVHTPRRILQDLTGQSIATAAMPFGCYNRRALREIRRAGFERCYSCDGGLANKNAWMVARSSVRQDMPTAAIHAMLATEEPLSQRLRRWAKGEIKMRL